MRILWDWLDVANSISKLYDMCIIYDYEIFSVRLIKPSKTWAKSAYYFDGKWTKIWYTWQWPTLILIDFQCSKNWQSWFKIRKKINHIHHRLMFRFITYRWCNSREKFTDPRREIEVRTVWRNGKKKGWVMNY